MRASLLSVSFFAAISSLSVHCLTNNWCPCGQASDASLKASKDNISANECQKIKGFFFSEERDFKCECCLVLKRYKESCKPSKNAKVLVRCAEGLHCDPKHVCRAQDKSRSILMIVKHPEPPQISHSFGRSFAQMLRDMMTCDCSTARCDNEVTRMECEAQQGLFVDKLSVRNRCQCCDRCYVPKGHHQRCAHSHVKNVQYVCDSGLYCSPFTHMCIEKREIFSQFMKTVVHENKYKGFKELKVLEDEPTHSQNLFTGLVRKKRSDDDEDVNLQAFNPHEKEAKEAAHQHNHEEDDDDGDKKLKEGHSDDEEDHKLQKGNDEDGEDHNLQKGNDDEEDKKLQKGQGKGHDKGHKGHKDGDEHDDHKHKKGHEGHEEGDEHEGHKEGEEHDDKDKDHKHKEGEEHEGHKEGDEHEGHEDKGEEEEHTTTTAKPKARAKGGKTTTTTTKAPKGKPKKG